MQTYKKGKLNKFDIADFSDSCEIVQKSQGGFSGPPPMPTSNHNIITETILKMLVLHFTQHVINTFYGKLMAWTSDRKKNKWKGYIYHFQIQSG